MRPSYRHADRTGPGGLPDAPIPVGARAAAGPPCGEGAVPPRTETAATTASRAEAVIPPRPGTPRHRLPSLSERSERSDPLSSPERPEGVGPGAVPEQVAAPAFEDAGAVPPLC